MPCSYLKNHKGDSDEVTTQLLTYCQSTHISFHFNELAFCYYNVNNQHRKKDGPYHKSGIDI